MRARTSDHRLEEAVEIIRQNGPCTYAYVRERVTKPCRGLSWELLEDPRVRRLQLERIWRWIYNEGG